VSLAGDEVAEGVPANHGVSELVPLNEPSRVGEARRVANLAGMRAALGSSELSNLGIIVNEITSNAVRHASGGFLIVRTLVQGRFNGVELLCIDRGPGISSISESMRDGYSTAGSMGTGLGAASRIASSFDMHTTMGAGTVVLARMWNAAGKPVAAPQFASICLPVPGERECGDGWGFANTGSRSVMFAVDGLGHGPSAAEASRNAVKLFRGNSTRTPSEILDRVHRGLTSTRGAAAAVSEIDLGRRTIQHAGIGNIAAWVMSEGSMRAMVSHNGILGHQIHRIQEFHYPLPADAIVVLQSDGLSNKWKPDPYPGLLRRDVALVAGVIYRDSARGRDDSTVLVYRPVFAEERNAIQ
jgi:anti-sigma regulatory factor (Ser/Thr protein kinase)